MDLSRGRNLGLCYRPHSPQPTCSKPWRWIPGEGACCAGGHIRIYSVGAPSSHDTFQSCHSCQLCMFVDALHGGIIVDVSLHGPTFFGVPTLVSARYGVTGWTYCCSAHT